MLKILGKIIGYTLLAVAGVLLLLVGTAAYLYCTADMGEPRIVVDANRYPVELRDSIARCGGSTLRRNPLGLWELTTGGDAVTRGAESGALLRDLMHYQEKVFVDQIRRIIPSDSYLGLLRAFIVIFNRNMAASVPAELRTEIYALSQFCSHAFDAFGTPYQRQLNYHAAHDIGHAMQEYMLVGCSSFAVWNDRSADRTLLVGRNFDFYVGDDFARNKLVTFCRPEQGYAFASVGWAGMAGVLSGMNAGGLTVTLNAAKGPVPTRAATPVSLLARTILQYAATIDEALAIADTTRIFVSESLLIASARDRRAAVIEKTPRRTALYEPSENRLRCTNHFQSDAFAEEETNLENIATSDSYYRFRRMGELLDSLSPLTPERAAAILRDRCGLGGSDIGLTNEKSLNQAIAHHGVVFAPEKGLMWVSTAPWQVGAFVCYDLNRILACDTLRSLERKELRIPADGRFLREDYPRILQYRADAAAVRAAAADCIPAPAGTPERLVAENPCYFGAWALCGDYYEATGDPVEARRCREEALLREIPRTRERKEIERKLGKS